MILYAFVNFVELDDVYWGGKKKVENEVVEHPEKHHLSQQSPITIKGARYTCV